MPPAKLPDSIRALIGEAAGEDDEGMVRVAKVIHTRARQRNLSVDAVVRQPKQFSAMERKDLDQFILRQPKGTTDRAFAAMERAGKDVGKGKEFANHYLSQVLYNSPERPSWAKDMKVVDRHGGHIFLSDR